MTADDNDQESGTLPSTSSSAEMHIDAARAKELSANVSSILSRIHAAKSTTNPKAISQQQVRLVAVSKLKPINDILALHHPIPSLPSSPSSTPPPSPILHFGENYQQELLQKSRLLPRSIRWHFIGALQTNKCKPLAEGVPNLWCVESVDTVRKADQLEKGRGGLVQQEGRMREQNRDQDQEEVEVASIQEPLRVFVQVNTSGEAEKSGVEPQDATALCAHIRSQCPHLKLQGLMTIGAIARSQQVAAVANDKEGEGGEGGESEGGENEDFVTLRNVRDRVVKELRGGNNTHSHQHKGGDGEDGEEGEEELELELSMGMSSDFESAIRCGSNEVRVGSTIFGERPARQDAKIQDERKNGGD